MSPQDLQLRRRSGATEKVFLQSSRRIINIQFVCVTVQRYLYDHNSVAKSLHNLEVIKSAVGLVKQAFIAHNRRLNSVGTNIMSSL